MLKSAAIKKIVFFSLSILILAACTTTPKAKPLAEVLRTVFFAQQVKHNNAIVYTKGGASNTVDNYRKLKMDLTAAGNVSFTDFDGNTFNGNYSLSTDNKTLTFSGLTPVPTGSGGTIVFSVVSFQESPAQVVLSRSAASVKTGNTVNEYTLTTTP
jgi:hypothetical protein